MGNFGYIYNLNKIYMIKEIKDQIIETIKTTVKTKGPISIELDSTELLDSVMCHVPHDSSMLDVRIEIEVDETGVKYICFEDDDDFDEEVVEFESLDLVQLSLILQKS